MLVLVVVVVVVLVVVVVEIDEHCLTSVVGVCCGWCAEHSWYVVKISC